MTTTAPDTKQGTAERWRYAGRRTNDAGRLLHEWLTPEHGTKWWKAGQETFVVGGYYDVRVTWKETGATMYGTPSFSSHSPSGQSAEWEVKDLAAVTEVKKARREASAKKDKALLDALAPLEAIAAKLIDPADMDALVAVVTRRLNQAQFRARVSRRS
jgi:hypothetical protein